MKLLGLLGFPLKHSFSPNLMNTLAGKAKLPFAYFPFEIKKNDLAKFMDAVRLLPVHGFNVTIPYKEAVLPFLDELSPEAGGIGAVNTVLNETGRLKGFNTDSTGFLTSVTKLFGTASFPESALVLGSGGAARAVVYGLLAAGVHQIFVVNRHPERAETLANRFSRIFPRAKLSPGPLDLNHLRKILMETDFIIQTTSVGTWPDTAAAVPFPFETLRAGQKVLDLVYNPPETEFLKRARRSGAEGISGFSMLIGQAAKALEIWGFAGQEEGLWKIAREMHEKNN